MTNAQRISVRLSQVRERLNTLAGLEGDDFGDEQRSESLSLQREYHDLETRYRSAVLAEGETEQREQTDPEPERLELRRRATLSGFLLAALGGRGPAPGSAESELAEAAGASLGQVPLELFDIGEPLDLERRQMDLATPAPAGGGVNLRSNPAAHLRALGSASIGHRHAESWQRVLRNCNCHDRIERRGDGQGGRAALKRCNSYGSHNYAP